MKSVDFGMTYSSVDSCRRFFDVFIYGFINELGVFLVKNLIFDQKIAIMACFLYCATNKLVFIFKKRWFQNFHLIFGVIFESKIFLSDL